MFSIISKIKMACVVLVSAVFLISCSQDDVTSKKSKRKHFVEVFKVTSEMLSIQQKRTGTLQAIKEIKIYTEENGKITYLPFYEGDVVTQGEVVARLGNRLLKSELAKIIALRKKAEQDVNRIRSLSTKNLTSQIELSRVETDLAVARANESGLNTRLARSVLKSPISGVVSKRLSELGTVIEEHTHLLTISDNSKLITKVSVPELFINSLSVGDLVEIKIDALARFQKNGANGIITRIHPNLSLDTRTGIVEVSLGAVPSGARPGQLARLIFESKKIKRLTIPFAALRRSSEGDYVFILDESKSRVKKVFVVSGLYLDERVEILKGLKEGQQVVTKGFTNLRHNKKVILASKN